MLVLILNICMLVSAVYFAVRLRHTIGRFHHRKLLSEPSMLHELPSVTVCIPARNERHAMTQCLESVLVSKYPKMEVIVLDDNSADNTSQLIKAFAHDGVRFIEGSVPPDDWLGKNYALNTLLREASGHYVIFMDVDTLLEPYSIGQLVAYAESTRKAMISVLPQRMDTWRASVWFAPLRYFWKLLFHTDKHPVCASSLWMVDRKKFIEQFTDFTPLKLAIEPEIVAAQKFLRAGSYSFLVSYDLLGVSYEKKLRSQIDTMMRLRYPSLHFSVVRTIGIIALLFIFALFPLVSALLAQNATITLAALIIYTVYYVCYWQYLRIVWKRGEWLGALLLPLLFLLDAWIALASCVGYLRGTVTWKGRLLPTIRRE